MKLLEFLDYLERLPLSPTTDSFIDKTRTYARKHGIPLNPVGVSNLKIGGPATYRPVTGPRTTCPSTCHFQRDGTSICYATHGHLKAAEMRASDGLAASLNAVALAFVVAARYNQTARLHVTGDFLRDDKLDLPYLNGVVALADLVRDRHRLRRPLAWAYTHVEGDQLKWFRPWQDRLMQAGVVVRVSDHWGWGGAVIADHHRVGELRKSTGLPVFKCPAQLAKGHSVTCQDCQLCWTRPELLVVFDVHAQHLDTIRQLSRLKEPQPLAAKGARKEDFAHAHASRETVWSGAS